MEDVVSLPRQDGHLKMRREGYYSARQGRDKRIASKGACAVGVGGALAPPNLEGAREREELVRQVEFFVEAVLGFRLEPGSQAG